MEREGWPECGTAQLNDIKENAELCQMMENVEVCQEIVTRVAEIAWIRCSSAKLGPQTGCIQASNPILPVDDQNGPKRNLALPEPPIQAVPHPRKRKLCIKSETQPSMQPRRRRRVGEVIEDSRKEEIVVSKTIERSVITVLKENQKTYKPTLKTVRKKNSIEKGAIQNGRKAKQVQKTKITKFFIPTKTPGLADWGCVEQNEEKVKHTDLYLIGGGGDTMSGSGGVGRVLPPADQGVGGYLDRISEFQIPTTSTNHG